MVIEFRGFGVQKQSSGDSACLQIIPSSLNAEARLRPSPLDYARGDTRDYGEARDLATFFVAALLVRLQFTFGAVVQLAASRAERCERTTSSNQRRLATIIPSSILRGRSSAG